jgi:UDP-3-O-[3-hydroxymyristoyl] N-acetylglucosamine deacetylase
MSHVRLHPAEGGVRFFLEGKTVIARLDHVTDTHRCTVLGAEGVKVALVEHLLAALHIRGWWRGLVIELSAAELPILDGSAQEWLAALDLLGSPPPPPPPLQVARPWRRAYGSSRVSVTPGARRLCCHIAFDHPAIGEQRWCGGPEGFTALAGARTFGFLSELESLRARGLAGAAGLSNVAVFAEEAPLAPLRFADEPVRHKALDALGDFFLLGRPLQAALRISRGSHRVHSQTMRDMIACGLVNGAHL